MQASATTTVADVITKLKTSPKTLPRVNHGKKLQIKFHLSNAAFVKLSIERQYGRAKKGKCKRTNRKNRQKRCLIYSSVMNKTKNYKSGSNKFTISASTVTRKLRPGAYRASLAATAGGVTTPPSYVTFNVSWK